MGTRCLLLFRDTHSEDNYSIIYRHWDGFPDGVLPDLDRFFEAVEAQCGGDNRYSDPHYLAAKFLVWQADRNSRREATPLDRKTLDGYSGEPVVPHGHPNFLRFLGVAPRSHDDGDKLWIEYRYIIRCGSPAARPTIEVVPSRS